ncbi:MAG: Hpt domain-containing protein [Candidatus Fibromonas sp.]|jgi:HPt (histidine-containing phosphotransfer) domain-containing protein|nr:Hpt domain-containing protein [Candidatus Fibromonas sp.]
MSRETVEQYVNFEDGIGQFGSEKEFEQILFSFKKHIPDLLKKLRECSGDDYIISVHALKGSARTIYANEIGDRAYELETAAKNGDWELVKSKNTGLIGDTQKLIDAIQTLQEG